MTTLRLLVLLLGPLPIVAASLGLSWLFKAGSSPARAEGNHVTVASRPVAGARRSKPAPRRASVAESLDASCQALAKRLRMQLGEECRVIVRPPFVLAGDMTETRLAGWYDRTIGPATRAMEHAYFRVPPDEPIAVSLFTGEQSYDRYAKALYGDAEVSIYGYYKRDQRALVMNAGTGAGTVVHELTHALADFDCPAIPDWLNEGLASLHEQCRIRSDETGIEGLENWRLPKLQQAIAQDRLRPLRSLIGDDDFRESDISVNYAQARYFFLWLERQGLLQRFFRRWRADQASDPLGLAAVESLFPGQSWDEIDRQYRQWVATLRWQPSESTASGKRSAPASS